jgi:hypothetical protein
MRGASWRLALVETRRLPVRVTANHRLTGAGCANSLAWVRTGSFSAASTPRQRTVTVSFEKRGRSANGETEDVYRFTGHQHVLVRRR